MKLSDNLTRWACGPITRGSSRRGDPSPTKKEKVFEKNWGNEQLNNKTPTVQWTTRLGEDLVKLILEKHGHIVFKPTTRDHKLPDLETDELIIEVKTRNWTTTGTAGEKVLGAPWKYADVPTIWKKPLVIICVAYQEYELTHGNVPILGSGGGPGQKFIKDMYTMMNIHFVPFSKLIEGDIKDLTTYIRNEYSQVGGRQETAINPS